MTTDELFERRLTRTLHDVLDGQPLPHPFWADAPAATRIASGHRSRGIRPLRLLAIAALLVVGGGAAAAGAWFVRTELPRPTPQLRNEVVVPTPQLHNESLKPTLQPAVPSNGWVAYSTGYEDNSDIMFTRPGGASIRAIGTSDDGIGQSCPSFSPNGRFVAFSERAPDSQKLTLGVVELDADGLPKSSPLRFTFEEVQDGNHRLNITTADFASGAGAVACPRWSPDGTHVALLVSSGVRVVDIISGVLSQLNGFGRDMDSPQLDYLLGPFAWAPDSSRIVYARQLGALNETSELWSAPLAGDESLLLAGVPNERIHVLDWSLSGRLTIAGGSSIVTETQTATESTGSVEFAHAFARVLDVAGGATQPMNLDLRPDPGAEIDSLHWAPDGTKVAFIHEGTLTVMEPGSPGSSLPLEVEGQLVLSGCVNGWSPTGDRLLVVAHDSGEYNFGGQSILLSVDPSGQSDVVVLRGWESGVPWGICGVTSWQSTTDPELPGPIEQPATPSPQPATPTAQPSQPPEPTPEPQTVSDGWIALNTYNGWTDDIYFVGPDGVMNRVVGSDGDTIWESCPTFSPDGTKLAFLEQLDGSSDTTEGVLAIAILDDNGLPQLPPARTDLHDNASCPSWSPDGSHLEVQTDSGLRVIDAITLSSALLASLGQVADGGQSNDYSVSGFAWGWDGQSLLYIKSPSVADGELELAELWTTQLDGTGDHRLIALEPGEVIDDVESLAPGRVAINTHQLANLSDGGFASSRFTVGEFDPTNPAAGITVVDAWEPDDNGSVDEGATFSRTGSRYAYVRQGNLFVGSTVGDQRSVALGGLGRPAWAACVIAWSSAEDAVLVVASDQPYLDRGVNTALVEVPNDGSRPPRIVLGWGAAGSYAECHSQWQTVAAEWTFPELIPSPSPDPSNAPSLRPKPTPSAPPQPAPVPQGSPASTKAVHE